MSLIKNAFVFAADLPSRDAMAEHLVKLPYSPLGETHYKRTSFIPNHVTKELVTPIEDGYTFTLRFDKKDVPQSVVNARAKDRIQEIEKNEERQLGRAEIKEIKDAIFLELLRVALVKTTEVNCFYNQKMNLFFIATSSSGMRDEVLSALDTACDGIEARQLYIADLDMRLTNRLMIHVKSQNGPDGFGDFEVGSYIQLKSQDGNKATFETDGQSDPADGITEASRKGCQVERLELKGDEIVFRLTKDFVFKSIRFAEPESEDDVWDDDAPGLWRHEAATQMILLSHAVESLCDLFESSMAVKISDALGESTSDNSDESAD